MTKHEFDDVLLRSGYKKQLSREISIDKVDDVVVKPAVSSTKRASLVDPVFAVFGLLSLYIGFCVYTVFGYDQAEEIHSMEYKVVLKRTPLTEAQIKNFNIPIYASQKVCLTVFRYCGKSYGPSSTTWTAKPSAIFTTDTGITLPLLSIQGGRSLAFPNGIQVPSSKGTIDNITLNIISQFELPSKKVCGPKRNVTLLDFSNHYLLSDKPLHFDEIQKEKIAFCKQS